MYVCIWTHILLTHYSSSMQRCTSPEIVGSWVVGTTISNLKKRSPLDLVRRVWAMVRVHVYTIYYVCMYVLTCVQFSPSNVCYLSSHFRYQLTFKRYKVCTVCMYVCMYVCMHLASLYMYVYISMHNRLPLCTISVQVVKQIPPHPKVASFLIPSTTRAV